MRPNERPSLAGELFSRIVNGDAISILRSMVESEPKEQETEWLEFKTYPSEDFKDQMAGCQPKNIKEGTRDFIKETWSEILSAFANTQGGVLIWGIRAKKNPANGIDAAHSLEPVPSPQALATRLKELQHKATDPPIIGIDVKSYENPSTPGRGFVVCYVPESPNAPHRAEYKGPQYFMRFGDSTVVPTVSWLRRLFYPSANSLVRAYAKIVITPMGHPSNSLYTFNCRVILRNQGRGSARGVCVGINYRSDQPNMQPIFSTNWLVSSSNHDQTVKLLESLHPGFDPCIFSLFSSNLGRKSIVVDDNELFIPNLLPIFIRLTIFQDDSEPIHLEATITEADYHPDRPEFTVEFSSKPHPAE